jgi:hypothetical protein
MLTPHTHARRNVRVTYNWKHFLYEDYDRALFGGLPANGTPSLLVTSPGTHDCMHYPAEFFHHGLEMRRFAQHMHLVRGVSWTRKPAHPF